MDLNEITVVILSRDRHECLTKTLRYWSKIQIRILVLDNSKVPLEVSKIPRNVKYLHSQTSYSDRCIQAVKLIDTKYAIMSSDDEVYLPRGLEAATNALMNDPELVSVGGQVLALGKYGPQFTYSLPYAFNYGYENLHEKPFDRLKEHFSSNIGYRNGSLYRLMRTKMLSSILISLGNMTHIRTPYISEVSSEILVNGLGKSKYVNELFWIRNWSNPPVQHKDWNRSEYFYIWAARERSQYESWINDLNHILGLNSLENSEIFRNVMKLRKSIEIHESGKKRPLTSYLPKLFRHQFIKTFMPNRLSGNFEEIIEQMKQKSINFSLNELRESIGLFASY